MVLIILLIIQVVLVSISYSSINNGVSEKLKQGFEELWDPMHEKPSQNLGFYEEWVSLEYSSVLEGLCPTVDFISIFSYNAVAKIVLKIITFSISIRRRLAAKITTASKSSIYIRMDVLTNTGSM